MNMEDIKLQFVRVYAGKNKMDVCVDDLREGGQRVVVFRWSTKGQTDVPPPHWYETVKQEVKYQRTQEWKRAQGRLVPQG